MAEMSINEIKENLWEIVDNKKAKERVKIKAVKQLTKITVQSLELIPFAGIVCGLKKEKRGYKRKREMHFVKRKNSERA